MRKVIKLLTVLLTVAAMLCACVMPGFAYSEIVYYGEGAYDSYTERGGDNDWGDWQGICYTESDLFGGFKNLMPGDSRYETIVFRNEAEDSDYVNLYMKFVPHDEFDNPLTYDEAVEHADGKDRSNVEGERDETVASMTDFLNQLTMRVYNGEELLYEGPATGLGYEVERFRAMPRALTASPLDAFISLGSVLVGDTIELLIELIVPIELGNEYANRVGEVDISFLLETFQTEQLTVRKVWSDGNDTHNGESIKVNLLKNGTVEKTAELNAENGWVFTFDKLKEGPVWTAEEASVPAGYTVSQSTSGNVVTIVNTKVEVPETPTPTPVVTPTPTAEPTPTPVVTPTPTAEPTPTPVVTPTPTAEPTPTVKPTPTPTVKPTPTPTVKPTPTPTVKPTPTPTVKPTPTPTAKPTPTPTVTPEVTPTPTPEVTPTPTPTPEVTPTPTPTPTPDCKEIKVKKNWVDRDNRVPRQVYVTLYNGEAAVETITLSPDNNWSHTWTGLDVEGNWQVMETNVPNGYTPTYKVVGDTVIITNTETLIQTGQLNWPVAVMGGAGVLLLLCGAAMIMRKKREADE